MASLVDSVMGFLGPIAGPLASQLGESTDTVQRGLQGGAAAMLSGLASRADEPGFLNQIFGLISNPANTGSALSALTSNPATALSGGSPLVEMGGRLLSTLFGSRMGAVTDALGQFSGVGANKAGTLLTMAAPMVLGALGKFVRDNHVNATSLASSLQSEAPKLQGFLPSGISNLFLAPNTVPPKDVAAVPIRQESTTSRWLWPVALLAALLLGALWFFNRSKAPVNDAVQTATNTASNAVQTASNAVSNTAANLGDFFKSKLPNGVELNIPQNGIENKLLAFIKDPSKPVDNTTWFNFDRLLFDTGKSTLQPSSEEQLNNIAEILKAYPNVHIKLGGYTDNTGDPAANKALSDARAKSVMNSLVSKGIDASRLEAQGYGDQYPVGDNSTEEGRALNRRISLRVTQK